MSEQLSMFGAPDHYPSRPGFREPTTSREAAEKIAPKVEAIRRQVLCLVRAAGVRGMTADEAAAILRMKVTQIRPRFSELQKPQHGSVIRKTPMRRPNADGNRQIVWVDSEIPEVGG